LQPQKSNLANAHIHTKVLYMLNRRQLRIKALQSLYAHFQSGSDDIAKTEKQLISNLERLYDLYIYQLSFLTALHRFATESMEVSKNKFIPTAEDLNPNTRFVDNQFLIQLDANKDFLKKESNLKINWSGAREIIRKIIQQFRQSEDYLKYIEQSTPSYDSDKEIVLILVRNHLVENDVLRSYFEEINSMWSEDYYMALAMINITIGNFTENQDVSLPLPKLFKDSNDREISEDKTFLLNLVRLSIENSKQYDAIITEKAANWEFDRIAVMDLILMRMGMAEIFEFPTVPLKVTLNEMIELAKHFSSPRSGTFINGLLDRTIADGLKNKTIVKKGRGLVGQ